MGNRAVITTEDKRLGIYLHWNGGRDSVEAFLGYCKSKGYCPPEEDNYGWACLIQVIRNFFGSNGMSVGVDLYRNLDIDNGDNGVYLIKDWKIVGREHFSGNEQEGYNLQDMMEQIDKSMPKKEPF